MWLRDIVYQQDDPRLTHDNGFDPSKRKDCTLAISFILAVMWETISSGQSEQQAVAAAGAAGGEDVEMSEDGDSDAHYIPKIIRRQMLQLGFDLLSYCEPRMSGDDECEFTRAAKVVMNTAHKVLQYQRANSGEWELDVATETVALMRRLSAKVPVDAVESRDLVEIVQFWRPSE